MPIHKIKITEIRERNVYIDSDYDFEALSKAQEMHNEGKITLPEQYLRCTHFHLEDNDET